MSLHAIQTAQNQHCCDRIFFSPAPDFISRVLLHVSISWILPCTALNLGTRRACCSVYLSEEFSVPRCGAVRTFKNFCAPSHVTDVLLSVTRWKTRCSVYCYCMCFYEFCAPGHAMGGLWCVPPWRIFVPGFAAVFVLLRRIPCAVARYGLGCCV